MSTDLSITWWVWNIYINKLTNCNVMLGATDCVLSRLKEKNNKVFSIGCICHLVNLCVKAAVKNISVSVDDLFVDIYYFFEHSTAQRERLTTKTSSCSPMWMILKFWSIVQPDGSHWKRCATGPSTSTLHCWVTSWVILRLRKQGEWRGFLTDWKSQSQSSLCCPCSTSCMFECIQ